MSKQENKVVATLDEIEGITETGLHLPDDYAFTHWIKLGEKFNTVHRDLPWLIGDWLIYGEYNYGERFVQEAERTGKKPSTLVRYRWVARKFPPHRRTPGIAWSIYSDIAGLEEAEQNAILDKVVNEGWGYAQVVAYRKNLKAIKEGKPLPVTARRCDTCGLTPAELRKKLTQRSATETVELSDALAAAEEAKNKGEEPTNGEN
jgi:hypothetical protein